MQTVERDLALQHLHDSRRRLLETVAGLSPEQRSFKPAELLQLAQLANLKTITIQRHFPYRLVLAASPCSDQLTHRD